MSCTVCGSSALSTVLSFGEQPPSNRFTVAGSGAEERYPLALGYCRHCSMIQLTERMPLTAVRPRFDWLVYNEPEGHLDSLAETLVSGINIQPSSRVFGLTYKDKTTLDRLVRLGIADATVILADSFSVPVTPFGLETIQSIASEADSIAQLASTRGKADVLIARHVIEHASDARLLISRLSGLLNPGGYLVFELPDSQRVLKAGNHAFIWEEHISYFTEESVRRLAAESEAAIIWFGRFAYPYEDSLVAVLRFDGSLQTRVDANDAGASLRRFAEALSASRDHWQTTLREYKRQSMGVAVFGAGHLAAKFINFLALSDLVDYVIDDHPKKVGMLMPGSRLPIVPSSDLAARNIRVCISTLNPESEAKVRARLAPFFEEGGQFLAAFATL